VRGIGGSVHQQGVGVAALRVETKALLDAESVLLVDDDEGIRPPAVGGHARRRQLEADPSNAPLEADLQVDLQAGLVDAFTLEGPHRAVRRLLDLKVTMVAR
jgi:hypothetical protein